jgi:hypothetical protein
MNSFFSVCRNTTALILLLALVGCGRNEKPVLPQSDDPKATRDLVVRLQPHMKTLQLANEAMLQGKFWLAIGLMDYLTNKAPDIAELHAIDMAFRQTYQFHIAVAIKQNAAQPRHRLSVEQLKPADRTRILLLMKRMQQTGQLPLEQRAAAAQELLGDMQKLTLDQPDLTRVWLMQASLCLLLDDSLHGKIAARNLAELRADESVNPSVQTLLRQLQSQGWLAAEIKLPELTTASPKRL